MDIFYLISRTYRPEYSIDYLVENKAITENMHKCKKITKQNSHKKLKSVSQKRALRSPWLVGRSMTV